MKHRLLREDYLLNVKERISTNLAYLEGLGVKDDETLDRIYECKCELYEIVEALEMLKRRKNDK